MTHLSRGAVRVSAGSRWANGGCCYADSGGPAFNAAGTQVAVTISGDTMCKATGIYQRLDTPAAQAFLAPYVG